MPLLFDALNIFTRKSRLASCAVSLASASAAPKTVSSSSESSNGPSTLEVVSVHEEAEAYTVQVEVGSGPECRSTLELKESKDGLGPTRISPRSPRRPTARHALLKCTVSPPTAKQGTLRRSSGSIAQGQGTSSGHRRKRSSSTSSIAEPVSVSVVFPTSADTANDPMSPSTSSSDDCDTRASRGTSGDVQPPRKRARRSAVSTTRPEPISTVSSPPSRCKQERSLSHSLGLDDQATIVSPTYHESSPTTSDPQPQAVSYPARSSSLPRSPRTNFTRQHRDLASMYHTLVTHHEFTIPDALEEQTSLGTQRKWSSKFDSTTLEQLRDQDGILLTRIYLKLLLSRVPVAPLQHDRLRRTREWDSHGAHSGSTGSDLRSGSECDGRGVDVGPTTDTPQQSSLDVESPWLGLDDGMDVDDARPQTLAPSPVDSTSLSTVSPPTPPPPSPDIPQWIGPPYPSLSHLIVDLILRCRHRASLDSSRRKRPRPSVGVSKSQTKSKLGLASVTLDDLVKEGAGKRVEDRRRRMDEVLDGLGMMDAERMDVDGAPDLSVPSTFGWCEADEEEVTFGREHGEPSKEDDLRSGSQPSRSADGDTDVDLDSDSDDDNEWKRLRIELVSGSTSDSTPCASLPIPIRPPSPVPRQLDSDDVGPTGRRRLPIRDVTNMCSHSRTRKSSASTRSGRMQKSPTSVRRPLMKIKYPEHALAASR